RAMVVRASGALADRPAPLLLSHPVSNPGCIPVAGSPCFMHGIPLSLPTLFAPIGHDMKCVDAVIRTRLDSDVPLISTIADYIIGAGGKRMRPALLLMIARALGYEGTQHHLLAAVVEFIHTA